MATVTLPTSASRVTGLFDHAPKQVLGRAQQEVKSAVHHELIKKVDLEKLLFMQDTRARQTLMTLILPLVSEQGVPFSASERERIANEVLDEVFGLGPLEPLLQDPTVNDILVNTHDSVYVERGGILEKTNVAFKDSTHLMHIIDKIVSSVGRRVDESAPMVDARLADGSRVNVIIPPLAVDGPILSIRRFGTTPLTADDLLGYREYTSQMLDILQKAVKARLNVIISGGTGAGKTTLLNVLSGFISERERIVTIEDSAELRLKQQPRGASGVPASERGRQRRRSPERVGNQRPAYAARSHRGGRGARRRGAGHVAGHEHGPRWLDHHRPRQQPT